MENRASLGYSSQVNSEEIPSLFETINSKSVAGFDEYSPHASTPRSDVPFDKEIEVVPMVRQTKIGTSLLKSPEHPEESSHSVRSSTPNTPSSRRVMFSKEIFTNGKSNLSPDLNAQQTKQKYHSQPITSDGGDINSLDARSKSSKLRDNRFDSFKTFSGKLERQITNLRGKPPTPESASNMNNALRQKSNLRESALPADRYFAALEGPELDTLKASEVSALPDDKKWPFLLRFPISSFGICLGVSSQAILWKTLAVTSSTKFLHVNLYVNLVLWYISIVLFAAISTTYLLKIILYFEAIRREYYHPIRINFFFAPWIACLFLALGVPPSVTKQLPSFSWYILMTPLLCLELKLYGQWMSGGQRRLSKVANPSNHLSVVGNFVGALLGASMGLKEGPIFFFAVGLAHYIVLFVTLYQRLPTNETLPVELHPVFFLFVAAPSVASMAWANISGSFDYGSRIAYFIAIFLYFSLAVRINFFRGFRFSLAWWAYTFPMTGAAIATIRYSKAVEHPFTQVLAVVLTAIATITVVGLLISTIVHAFVLRDLFPNDISIAVTETKQNRFHLDLHLPWTASTEADLENALHLKPTKSDPSGLNSELDKQNSEL